MTRTAVCLLAATVLRYRSTEELGRTERQRYSTLTQQNDCCPTIPTHCHPAAGAPAPQKTIHASLRTIPSAA
eukprot:202026-Hanusia_phi.AAC.1